MTSTNYSNRQVDLCLFPDLTKENVSADTTLSDYPKVISGFAMAIQNYIRVLMTPLGHYSHDPEFGSNLISRLQSTRVRYPSDVTHIFVSESDRVLQYIKTNERSSALPDEKIKTVDLISSSIDRSSVSLSVDITSQSSIKSSFLIPVNWTI